MVRMVRVVRVLIFVLLIAACDGAAPDSTAADRVAAATTTFAAENDLDEEQPVETDGLVPDYSALIASVESAMEGTTYEGAALEDPEVFIATAEVFCDLLAEGMTQEELLAEYLDRLSNEGELEVDEDDGLMAGVLLGASIEIVCPESSGGAP